MSLVGYYVGIARCGCVRGALVDDELTTAKGIAEFALRQQKAKRQMKHVEKIDWRPHPDCTEHATGANDGC